MEKIASIRLLSQQLVNPVFEEPGKLVAWMGAMQAQEYTMAKWALGMRIKEGTLAAVDEALERGEVVRTHVMRPTWHYVAGEDIRWMLKLSGQRIKKCIDLWTKGSGVDVPESLYTKCNDLLGKILSGNKSLSREEIEVELSRSGVLTDHDRVKRYLLRAEVEAIVCSGGDRNGKPTYSLLEEHVPPGVELCKEEALAKLALNFFRSHSPATLKDFIWWGGLSVSEAKAAVGGIKNQLIIEKMDSEEFFIHESCRETLSDACIHFLPPYDEYLISYKDRSAVLNPKHTSKAHNRWGIFYPVILYNGQVVGNWNRVEKKKQFTVETSFFESGMEKRLKLLKGAEENYRKFRENNCSLSL